jgi:hypothetical protein
MGVNADKPTRWKQDIASSVDLYNEWFMRFAPEAFRKSRVRATSEVEQALAWTKNLTDVAPSVLRQHPEILPMLRMATAPPIARDRLIGLGKVAPGLVRSMELEKKLPPRMSLSEATRDLTRIGELIEHLADRDLFPWLDSGLEPDEPEVRRAATVVADRLCGAVADPIVRNAQEQRQLSLIRTWLEARGYRYESPDLVGGVKQMVPGTFTFRFNVAVSLESGDKQVNIPVDVAIMPLGAAPGTLPLLIEAKSAGDFTNTNKRRKEEAIKVAQLRRTYGGDVRFVLFLCGYFDSGYLGYEAAEGIDWVWEHRMDDLAEFGV